jgi:hypothetical protein
VLSRQSEIFRYVDYAATDELWREHNNGQVNRRLLIWSLLSFSSLLDASKS